MPQAQVINFGEDPYANAMGSFARGFLGEINEKTGQRRNEELFSRIKSKYENDDPEKLFKDVLEAEGFDQEYKRNKLKEITEYASLSTKINKSKYEKELLETKKEDLKLERDKVNNQAKNLSNQELRLQNDAKRLDISAKKNSQKLPGQISKFTSDRLKDADLRWPVQDVSALNNAIEQLMTSEEALGSNEAFQKAFELVEQRREVINNAKITSRPKPWVGSPTEKEVLTSLNQAYEQLKQLHDEQGVNSQKDLRAIAERYGWEKEEITEMLRRIFKEAGQKFKEPKQKETLDITDSILYGQ